MITEIELKGTWYLPGKPRRRVPGMLKFTPGENPSLELDGSLQSDNLRDNSEFSRHTIILGISSGDGKLITLFECSQNRRRGSQSSRFSVQFVFVGEHFKNEEELRFNRIFVQYQHLGEWTNISGFNRTVRGAAREHIISYTELEPIVIASTPNWQIEADAIPSSSVSITEAHISEEHVIRMHFTEYKNFFECLDFARTFQNFLTLAVGDVTFPIKVEVQRGELKIARGRVLNFPVEVYYNPARAYKERFFVSTQMLFTMSDTKEHMHEYIVRWYEKHIMLKPVFDLYFSILYSPFTYVTNSFLNLAQAVETYHRRVYGGKYQDNDTFREGLYKTLVDALPQDISSDFRTSLVRGRLFYANEYSLRKRLNELLIKIKGSLPDIVVRDDASRKMFADKVVDVRNYLTHYDESTEYKSDDVLGLIELETKLRLILEACFLREIGFGDETIQTMLSKSSAHYILQSLKE